VALGARCMNRGAAGTETIQTGAEEGYGEGTAAPEQN